MSQQKPSVASESLSHQGERTAEAASRDFWDGLSPGLPSIGSFPGPWSDREIRERRDGTSKRSPNAEIYTSRRMNSTVDWTRPYAPICATLALLRSSFVSARRTARAGRNRPASSAEKASRGLLCSEFRVYAASVVTLISASEPDRVNAELRKRGAILPFSEAGSRPAPERATSVLLGRDQLMRPFDRLEALAQCSCP